MARIGIAALHKLPGKSSLNVNFVCPICSVCPDDHDDHGNNDEHDDHGNNDDQIGVSPPNSLTKTVTAGGYPTKRTRTAALNCHDRSELIIFNQSLVTICLDLSKLVFSFLR